MQELSDIHQRGNTIVMVTHNSRLTSYADRIIHMLDGQIDRDTAIHPPKEETTKKRPLSRKSSTKKAPKSPKKTKKPVAKSRGKKT